MSVSSARVGGQFRSFIGLGLGFGLGLGYVRRGRDSGSRDCRRIGATFTGTETLDAMGSRANAESLAKSGAETLAAGGRNSVSSGALVGSTDMAEGSEALLHGGIVHTTGIQVVRETMVGMSVGCCVGRRSSLLGRGFLRVLGILVLLGIFFRLGRVQVDTTDRRLIFGDKTQIKREHTIEDRYRTRLPTKDQCTPGGIGVDRAVRADPGP